MENTSVAVFIDAENLGSQHAKQIFETASNYGDVIIKRIFGDWTNKSISPWKEAIEKYSIVADQQFSFVKGKNSSDISLIIQVMVALFEKNIDTFIIVSGDSDFTRLIQELRERKKTVIGMGSKKSISSYVNSFSEFIYINETSDDKVRTPSVKESPLPDQQPRPGASEKQKKTAKPKRAPVIEEDKLKTLTAITENLIDINGKAPYSQIAVSMKNKYSDFIPQNYGCNQFRKLILKILPFMPQFKEEKEGLHYYLINK